METKKVTRWYWVWDYEKEELWLNAMAQEGWTLQRVGFATYYFERTEPGEYVVRLEFRKRGPFAVGVPAPLGVSMSVHIEIDSRNRAYSFIQKDRKVSRCAYLLPVHRPGFVNEDADGHPVGTDHPFPDVDGLHPLVSLSQLPRIEEPAPHTMVGHGVVLAVSLEGLRDGRDVLPYPAEGVLVTFPVFRSPVED